MAAAVNARVRGGRGGLHRRAPHVWLTYSVLFNSE